MAGLCLVQKRREEVEERGGGYTGARVSTRSSDEPSEVKTQGKESSAY